jgi:anion-transporting  ArsA/GET3 family ATPase
VKASARQALARALAERRVVVVCGAGGVGKTTTAAALAVHAAVQGRRVLVCTIDPSRRLATSLGLQKLPDKPRRLDLAKAGIEAGGEMWAMTLDTKKTFDELVERHAGSAEARKRILDNRFYQKISAALAGSHEYMAMEKMLELSGDGRFDLVVLDTPPTRHALDFLEAPERMMGFLDASVLRWFLKPYFVAGRLTLKVATATGRVALKLVDRYLGLQFLQDLSEFFLAFESMYAGFKERAAEVHRILRVESSGFVLVASPARVAVDEALYFHQRLQDAGMPFVATVVNRAHPDPAEAGPVRPRRRKGAAADIDADLARALLQAYDDLHRLARAERRVVSRLEVDTGEPLLLVPELESDVHDLRGLALVAQLMLGGEEPADARRQGARGRSR